MTVTRSQHVDRRGVSLAADKCEELGLLFREQGPHDQGIDAHIELKQEDKATGSLIALQIKSGNSYFSEPNAEGWTLRGDLRHANYWLGHSLPVVVMLCDVDNRRVYWEAVRTDTIQSRESTYKILIPRAQELGERSLAALRSVGSVIVPPYEYSITKQSDVSHGLAKRYDLRVVLNKALTKPEIAAVHERS